MIRLHEPEDVAKLDQLAMAMREQGWQGAPLVADGDDLITGAHRHYAWTQLVGRAEFEIPIIDIRELCPEYDEIMADESDWYVGVTWIVSRLPAEIREQYGLDIE